MVVRKIETVEDEPENSEEAERAKRIIYWIAAVFILLPLILLGIKAVF